MLRAKHPFLKRPNTYLPGREPNCQQTYRWLLCLAYKLKQDKSKEFSIEQMQPDWLETKSQKWRYRILVGIISGLAIALIYALGTGLIGATIGGLTYGLILAMTKEVYLVPKMRFSIKFAKFALWESLKQSLWWGFIYGFIDAIICWFIWGIPGFIIGMVQVIIWGLVEGIIWGCWEPEFTKENSSDRGIRESAINAVIFTVIGGILWLGFYLLYLWAVREPLEPLSIALDTISNGLFFTIYMGGFTCLQHFLLRSILAVDGAIPWNYAKFLDYATKQGFLEREGGRFSFKYDLLENAIDVKIR
ncbi:hypothetical protein ACE1CD_08715 [Aerosakkonema sp. BLCC-F183]|uniref:hypothetical protein n=1 Tax=Aerosakkonema sp. BLCC-F183 TaxID=3342834 RepID=UPI0035B70BB4